MDRPVVVLPQPLPPTSPSVSARLPLACPEREDALPAREELAQPPHFEERRNIGRRQRHATAPTAAPISLARRQADRCPAGPTGSSGGHALAQASMGERARGREAPPSTRGRGSGG